MFSMHDFIMKGLLDAVGKMADYQVILNAAGWNAKGVLSEEDLAVIQKAIDDKNAPSVELEPADGLDPMMGVVSDSEVI